MKDEIVNGLLQNVPGVEMTAFTLGTVPLRVVGIKGVRTSFDAMHLDLEIRWSSDLYARLEVRAEWKRTFCCVFDYKVPDAFWCALLLCPCSNASARLPKLAVRNLVRRSVLKAFHSPSNWKTFSFRRRCAYDWLLGYRT